MKKTAGVYTNDKNRPLQDLVISGPVEKFATIRPKHVSLRGYAGDPIKGQVSIISEKKYPFKIVEHTLNHGNDISYELEQVKLAGGIEYVLTVVNLKNVVGNYYNTISLKTDSKIQPSINIRVNGYIQYNQPIK